MSNHAVRFDSMFTDDFGSQVNVVYIDLRYLTNRSPIKTLVKGCEAQFAIDQCKKLRVSKAERFRVYGEGLIRDPLEAYAAHSEEVSTTSEDPRHSPEGRILLDQLDSLARDTGMSIEVKKWYAETRQRTTDILTYGKNGWLFCASIEPTTKHEWDKWRRSLPEKYDNVSYIHSPCEFARSLGLMVTEQLGPLGQEAEMKHSFEGAESSTTYHKGQFILHGPVVYVKDLYQSIHNAPSLPEAFLRSIFMKQFDGQRKVSHRDQREYRFAILAEEEPHEEVVDLDVSLAMLGTMLPYSSSME